MAKSKEQSKAQRAHYLPEQVHTIPLSDLFELLHQSADWMRSTTRVSDEFNGCMSYSEALTAAEFGQWHAPKIKALTFPELTAPSDELRYFNDVTGGQLDIAAFCSGEPEYWQNAEPIQKPIGRVLRFAVEIGGLGDVEAGHLRARGEAIIALVNSLELQGHSVEITVIRAWTNTDKKNYKLLIPVKHAGQALDTKRFQFIIGHPAFYRRCLFGLTELAQGKPLAGSGCGTWTQEFAPDGFIHIGHKTGLAPDAIAMKWAQEFASTLAETFTHEN